MLHKSAALEMSCLGNWRSTSYVVQGMQAWLVPCDSGLWSLASLGWSSQVLCDVSFHGQLKAYAQCKLCARSAEQVDAIDGYSVSAQQLYVVQVNLCWGELLTANCVCAWLLFCAGYMMCCCNLSLILLQSSAWLCCVQSTSVTKQPTTTYSMNRPSTRQIGRSHPMYTSVHTCHRHQPGYCTI